MPVEAAPGIRPGTHCFYGKDNYSYHVNKFMRGGRVSLRCTHYNSLQCHGRASCTRRGKAFKQTQPHNHMSDATTKEARLLRAAVMNRCREDSITSLRDIYHQERRRLEISPASAAWVPYNRLRSSMLRARYELLPNIPRTLPELAQVLTNDQYQHLSKTLDDRGSVYAGTFGRPEEGTCCTIFCSRRQRRYLKNRKLVFSDATFDSVPAGLDCRQVWNVTTVRRGRIIPVARILMQTKSYKCYKVAILALQRLVRKFKPKEVVCDFEAAQLRAWKKCFPYIKRRGCLFHFTKNATKTAAKLGLVTRIREDREVNRCVRMVCAIPLLPPESLEKGLIAVGKRAMKKRRSPHRTSNTCESDNALLARTVGAPHPNAYRFLGGVVEMEDVFAQDVAILRAGGTPSRQRRHSTMKNDERIQAFQLELEEGDISVSTFLRRVSRRIEGSFNKLVGIKNV